MSADGVPSHYTSYLLRVWRIARSERTTCRALLENIATGERVGFSDLDGLPVFLEKQTPDTCNEVAQNESCATGTDNGGQDA
ncbi:hypothetical protein [Chloroflexus aggregans]|uniref:Uncharacterized protein n=1 Tax=Chloroflexus aggregans (strain MD-66 / DSM 9485) TaxID=326427 RepID=B8G879_CHLAD|nr:hypothetical protein [Chloroflexus aggregans]ACL26133.1 hypothetical protein Cagg_3280 [Chloroflexus aggregans DSM 9485]